MEAIFIRVLNMSLSASVLILAVVLLRPLLKRAPRWTSLLLWAMVALRLLVPFSIQSSVSLIPAAEPIPVEIARMPSPAVETGIPAVNQAVNPVLVQRFAPDPINSVNPLQVVEGVAVLLWLAGVLGMLLFLLFSFLRAKRSVRAAIPWEDQVYVCDEVRSPFVLGMVRPRIYVPSDLDEATRKSVLLHEQAHLRRRDHWWKPLGFLILALHWFNPLCWLAYILFCRDIEAACDERAIAPMDSDGRAAYSQALLDCSRPQRMVTVCPLAFGETGVKGRVKAVLGYHKPLVRAVVAALTVIVLVAVCFLTDPQAAREAQASETAAESTALPSTAPAVADTAAPTELSAPVATEAPKAEAEAVRRVGVFDVVANDGAKAGTEAYPYMVKTKYSVWYLAQADIELQGEDAFFGGLEEVLQYFDEDVEDAQRALAGRIPAKNPPVEIRTDFCGQAGVSETAGAYYNGMANFIKLFHGWEMVRYALLHEYVHYLTFHCAEKKTSGGFFGEAVAEYVSRILCKNRMMRSMDPSELYDPEMLAAMRAWGIWDDEIGGPDYRKSVLCESDAFARGLYDGQQYQSVGQRTLLRMGDRPIPYHVIDLSYAEGESLALYLIETYGEDRFLDNWDTPPDKVAKVYDLTEEELLTVWSEWNAQQCAALGIRMELPAQ